MKYKLIVVLFSLIIFNVLTAQETKTLTLKEAITLSLNNSKQIKLNQEKISEATLNIKEAQEKKLPEASASASYMYLPIKPTVNLKIGAGSGGGVAVHQAMFTSINGSIPLYTAHKIDYGIQSLQYLQQAISIDAENDKSAIIINAINACINLFKAHQAISLVKENLAQAKQRLNDFTNLEKNGLLARNDLLKANLQVSNVELTLLDVESNYKMACVNMNIIMGLPEQTILVPDKNGLALPTEIKSIEAYEQDALQNRKELEATGYRKKMAELGVKSIKAEKYPNVVLTGGYIAADVPKFLTVYNAINIGVGVKYNIANIWKNKTKISLAESKVNQIQLSEDILSDNIKLQINQAYQNYLVSVKKINVLEQSIEQSSENYRITKNKYNNSLATTTDLLEADVALFQAKLSVTNAKADSFTAYNKLLYVSGLLTEIN